jgi:hypothetical protein
MPLTLAEVVLSWNAWPVVAAGGVLAESAVDVRARIATVAPNTIAAEMRVFLKDEDVLIVASLRLPLQGLYYPRLPVCNQPAADPSPACARRELIPRARIPSNNRSIAQAQKRSRVGARLSNYERPKRPES